MRRATEMTEIDKFQKLSLLLEEFGFSVEFDPLHEPNWRLLHHVGSFDTMDDIIEWITVEFEDK